MGKKTRNQDVKTKIDSSMFGTESIGKILLHTAPPVMLAQLIQALYNIVDSYFVGKFSANGLTALSVIFPVQLVITALAIGIGVGVNTLMARQYAQNESEAADKTAGTGLVLTVACWALFTLLAMALLRPYASMSAQSPEAVELAVLYGRICCVGSLGIFMESVFTKVHQANGNLCYAGNHLPDPHFLAVGPSGAGVDLVGVPAFRNHLRWVRPGFVSAPDPPLAGCVKSQAAEKEFCAAAKTPLTSRY